MILPLVAISANLIAFHEEYVTSNVVNGFFVRTSKKRNGETGYNVSLWYKSGKRKVFVRRITSARLDINSSYLRDLNNYDLIYTSKNIVVVLLQDSVEKYKHYIYRRNRNSEFQSIVPIASEAGSSQLVHFKQSLWGTLHAAYDPNENYLYRISRDTVVFGLLGDAGEEYDLELPKDGTLNITTYTGGKFIILRKLSAVPRLVNGKWAL